MAEVTETGHKSLLCQTNSRESLSRCRINGSQNSACQNNEYGQIQNNKGIDKDGNHRTKSLCIRALRFSSCMRMRRRTHTGFVREKTSCNTVTDSLTNRDTDCSTLYCLRIKGADEDGSDCSGKRCNMHYDKNQSA